MMNIFMRYPGQRTKALTLSYDDGVQQDQRLISIMRRHGLRGTFNINTGLFAPAEGEKGDRMTREQAINLYRESGMEVAVHASTHPYLEQLPLSLALREVMEDRAQIEAMFGGICRGMAYPYGTCSDALADGLKTCGILYARTTVSRRDFKLPDHWLRLSATCHHNDPKLMELAEDFAARQGKAAPLLFYLWGHSYEFDRNGNWEIIENFASFLGGREDIWYATNLEIFEYIESYRLLRFSMNGKTVYNPAAVPLYFCAGGQNITIRPGETILLP